MLFTAASVIGGKILSNVDKPLKTYLAWDLQLGASDRPHYDATATSADKTQAVEASPVELAT